jgi:hypothetical protein
LRAIIAMAAPLGRVSRVYGGSLACLKPREAATASSRIGYRAIFLEEVFLRYALNVGRRDGFQLLIDTE